MPSPSNLVAIVAKSSSFLLCFVFFVLLMWDVFEKYK
jgi:hypothetical protein